MDTITLQFQTPHDLAGFRKQVANSIVEVNIKELILVCACALPEVATAINYYGA